MKTGDFIRRLGFAVPVTGIKTTVVVRCDQPHVIDLAALHAHQVDTLSARVVDEVLAKVSRRLTMTNNALGNLSITSMEAENNRRGGVHSRHLYNLWATVTFISLAESSGRRPAART